MKIDNSGLDTKEFARFLEQTYTLKNIHTAAFIPKGEEGYGYELHTDNSKHFFVKAGKDNDTTDIAAAEV